MSEKKTKSYTAEFKENAVKLAVESDQPVTETARELEVKDDLADMDKTVSRKRIGRLMKEEGLACKTKRKFKATTDSNHNKPVADNLLKRDFNREQPDQAGGITYVPTREGCLYRPVCVAGSVLNVVLTMIVIPMLR